jgi:hypothetical protein
MGLILQEMILHSRVEAHSAHAGHKAGEVFFFVKVHLSWPKASINSADAKLQRLKLPSPSQTARARAPDHNKFRKSLHRTKTLEFIFCTALKHLGLTLNTLRQALMKAVIFSICLNGIALEFICAAKVYAR